MILSDKEIRDLCKGNQNELIEGSLISPFDETSLQSESYDLSIGDQIAVLRKEVRCIDITNQYDIDSIYDNHELPLSGYVISPKEYVLVSLKEKIELPETLTAHIRPRTRFTRLGLIVSDQHCNSTYAGTLNVGLFNSTDYAIKIFPGVKIAQIVFEELKSIPSSEKQYKNKPNAVYHNEESFIGGSAVEEFNKTISEAVSFLLEKRK